MSRWRSQRKFSPWRRQPQQWMQRRILQQLVENCTLFHDLRRRSQWTYIKNLLQIIKNRDLESYFNMPPTKQHGADFQLMIILAYADGSRMVKMVEMMTVRRVQSTFFQTIPKIKIAALYTSRDSLFEYFYKLVSELGQNPFAYWPCNWDGNNIPLMDIKL